MTWLQKLPLSTNAFLSHHIRFIFHRFDGAGFSREATREVLASLSSNAVVAEGEVVSAAEVLWTPSDREEIMTSRDLILDFPTLINL